LPREVIERLSRDLNEVLKSDELKKLLATDGLEPAGGAPRTSRPHQERGRALEGRRREGEGEDRLTARPPSGGLRAALRGGEDARKGRRIERLHEVAVEAA
jgi:hypothetical protein